MDFGTSCLGSRPELPGLSGGVQLGGALVHPDVLEVPGQGHALTLDRGDRSPGAGPCPPPTGVCRSGEETTEFYAPKTFLEIPF